MPQNTSTLLIEKLTAAETKAAELEAEIKVLRSALQSQASANPPAPSFLIESITDAFVALDRECRYTWVNGEAERLMGMSRDQVIGKVIWHVFPGTIASSIEANCRSALDAKRTVEFEYYYPPFDRWFWNKAYYTVEGGLAIFWRDVTEQKRSQELINRQALILGQVHDSIITTNLTGIVQTWNRGAERITGYSAEEAIGQHISLLYFEEDRGTIEAEVLEPLRRHRQLQLEMRNRHRSGDEIYLRLSLSLLCDESGNPSGMVGVATDETERRKAGKALRESEERYRSLASAMPQIAYTTGPDGKTHFVNDHWLHYSGMTPESCRDFQWMTWIHPEDAGDLMARWIQNVNNGEPFQAKYRLRDKEGSYRWQLGRALPVRDSHGAIAHWVGTVTDIHDCQVAEQIIAQSEERFRLAVLAFNGIVYDWDLTAKAVDRIGDFEAFIGHPPDPADASLEWWTSRIHPDDRDRVTLAIESMSGSDRNTFELEYRLQHANSGWIHVWERGYAIRSGSGDLLRIVGSAYNISSRKELELELKRKNERLARQSSIFDLIKDAVVATGADGCITYCNPAAEQLYAVRRSQMIGQPLSAIVEYRWLKPEEESLANAELMSSGTWSGETIHVLKNGSQIVVNSSVKVLPAELGGGTIAVIRDVSRAKAAELELENRARQLTKANQDLLHFAYTVSHDLQAPLRTITSFGQLLALFYRDSPGPKADDYIVWIVEAASRMSTMLSDLVKFAQAAGGTIDTAQEVSLETPLSDALKNLRGQIEESQATVNYDPMPTVYGDAGQYVALFQNLIGNSLKYRNADHPPIIRVTAQRTVDTWQISIRDNGIGFEPEFAERIFGVFQRLHSDKYSGTGVGLAICRRIVERMGGHIWAEGHPGQGAVFTFSIPVHRDAWTRQELHTPPAAAASKFLPTAIPPPAGRHFDELFQILDLAQAIVRKLDGTITIWTASSERILGWQKNEALGANADELLATEYPVPQKEIEATLLREGRWSGELKKRRKDGQSVWLASHWVLHTDGSGRPESIVEVYDDITGLKTAERELTLTLERFQAAIEASPVVVFTQDMNLRYTWIHNPALGYSPNEVAGTSDFDLFERAEDAERLIALKRAVIESGSPRREAVQIQDRGTMRWFDLNIKPQFENGVIAGVLCTAIDITEPK